MHCLRYLHELHGRQYEVVARNDEEADGGDDAS